jgi:hypothetical protein
LDAPARAATELGARYKSVLIYDLIADYKEVGFIDSFYY